MIISFDIETAKPMPSNTCPKCGGFDFTELDENGVQLMPDQIRCIECGEIGSKYIAFVTNWRDHAPLGVSCAAACYDNGDGPKHKLWYSNDVAKAMEDGEVASDGAMTKDECVAMVMELMEWRDKGHTIATWNGLAFDFPVLEVETGMATGCTELALAHVDMMFYVIAIKGYRLGLEAALLGAGLPPKLHEVTLKSGEVITEMSGAMAPLLWQQGEYEAVLDYLKIDVEQTVSLASHLNVKREIRWTSKNNRKNSFPIPRGGKLPTIAQCLQWRKPNTSWMTNPPTREEYTSWMNGGLGIL